MMRSAGSSWRQTTSASQQSPTLGYQMILMSLQTPIEQSLM